MRLAGEVHVLGVGDLAPAGADLLDVARLEVLDEEDARVLLDPLVAGELGGDALLRRERDQERDHLSISTSSMSSKYTEPVVPERLMLNQVSRSPSWIFAAPSISR